MHNTFFLLIAFTAISCSDKKVCTAVNTCNIALAKLIFTDNFIDLNHIHISEGAASGLFGNRNSAALSYKHFFTPTELWVCKMGLLIWWFFLNT